MNPSSPKPASQEEIERAAAQWVLRRDRGLSAAEQDEFSQWLAADPRHGEALAVQRWGWDELDRLTGLQASIEAVPDPDLFAPHRDPRVRRGWWIAAGSSLAAAAVVALLFYWRAPGPVAAPANTAPAAAVAALAAPCERRTLEDGSVVELNHGAEVEVVFTAEARRVRLVRGEANFTVAKNPQRPFVVNAAGVEVRAVGTVFNVRLDAAAVEVVVSEGRVKVATPTVTLDQAPPLDAGQYAVVPLAEKEGVTPKVETLSPAALAALLAWRPQLLDFSDAPLSAIVADFNRHNAVQLTVGEPSLGALRLSVTFRSDNIEGFVHLMESDFGMKTEWRGEREIVLRRAK